MKRCFEIINKNDSIDLLFQLDEKEVISAIDYDGINKIWVGTTTGMGYYDIKEKRYGYERENKPPGGDPLS